MPMPMQQFEQRLHIVGDPGHDPTDSHPVIKTRWPPLHVREQIQTHVAQRGEHSAREGHPMQVIESMTGDA